MCCKVGHLISLRNEMTNYASSESNFEGAVISPKCMGEWLHLLVKTRLQCKQWHSAMLFVKKKSGMWFIVCHLISLRNEMTNYASSESNSEDAVISPK